QRQIFEFVDGVDLGAHGNVGHALQDNLDDHRNLELLDQLFGLAQGRGDVSRFEDAQSLATQAFGNRDMVDTVAVEFRSVEVVEGQLHTVVHVKTALFLTDQ